MILALNCGAPVAALDVGKGLDLLRMLGLQKNVITGEDWNVDFPTTDGERTKSIIASMRQFYRLQLGIALSEPKTDRAGRGVPAADPATDYLAQEQRISALIENLSPGAALAFSHRQARQGQLAMAMMLAEIAIKGAATLAEGEELSANILLASLLERRGDLANAARTIARAVEIAPENRQAIDDRDRILSTLASLQSERVSD